MTAGGRVQARLAWRYLKGRGLRSLLTTLAVVFGVMLIFGLGGVIPTLMQAFDRGMLATAGRIDLSVTSAFREPFGRDVVDTVTRTDGVAAVSPSVQRTAPLPVDQDAPLGDQVAQVLVLGVDPATAGRVRDFPLQSGRALAVGDADVAVLASDLAGRLGVAVGDGLTLPSSVGTTVFRVVGLLSSASVPGEEQVIVPLASAQRLFALGDRVTVLDAALTPGADRAAVEASVRAALGPDYTVGGLSSNGSLLASLQMTRFAFTMFGVFALATAGFIILNSFRTVVAERRRDIGMLRAVGAPRRTIQRMFLLESLAQGIAGTAVGILAGWGMAVALFAVLNPLVERVLHLRLGSPVFEPDTWVLAIVLGVGTTVLAAAVPARAAGRITPMEALRPPVGEAYRQQVGRRAWVGLGVILVAVFAFSTRQPGLVALGAVAFLAGIALVAPAILGPLASAFGVVLELAFAREGAIARSNLQRNPARSALTVTAVMLGLASIVAMITVVQSVTAGFAGYIDKSLSADYMVIPRSIVLQQGNVAAGPRLLEEVRHVDGIGPVSSLRIAQGKLNGADAQVIGIDPATYPLVASFDWNEGSADAAIGQLAGGRWLIANGIFAGQAGLAAGDSVALETPNGPRRYLVAGVGNDYLNVKLSTVFVSQDALARDFNTTTDVLVMADRSPGADPDAVRAALDAVVADYPAFRLYESAEWKDEQLATFASVYAVYDVLIVALALPSLLALVNTLAISVLARTREIGMLRAVGATRRQVRRMVLAESLLLSTIGTVFGVVAGLALGYALVLAMRQVGWVMPYGFPWVGVAITVVVGIVFGMLAALAPARSASRLDVVAALHQD